MPVCGKCGKIETVEEVRRCYGALPYATVAVDEFEQGQVEPHGSNYYLRETNQYLHDQHQADVAYDEAHPLVQNFPPSLRVNKKFLTLARYENRTEIKMAGGRWDPKNRMWYFDGEVPNRLKRFLSMNDPDRVIRGPVAKSADDDELEGPIRQGADFIKRQGGGLDFGKLLEEAKSGEAFLEEPKKGVETQHRFAVSKEPVDEGFYRKDGTVYKVQWNQGETAKYAKQLVILHDQDDGGRRKGEWDYAPGAMKLLSVEDQLTLDEAKEFGKLYGVCCICGRRLTNEASIEAGIGPICREKF